MLAQSFKALALLLALESALVSAIPVPDSPSPAAAPVDNISAAPASAPSAAPVDNISAAPASAPTADSTNSTDITPQIAAKQGSYPFNELVVYGDQLSDNGNGSYAHGLDPTNIYQHHTWTDGPVAVQYLSTLLDVPLTDYAWGGKDGGGLAGATVDNTYTPAKDTYNGAPVPSTQQQIAGYLAGGKQNIANSLQLIWVGQNDVKRHTNWFSPPSEITPENERNQEFFEQFPKLLLQQAESLIEAGAPAVVVMNIYTLHLAPECTMYFCKGNEECATNWGKVIQAANSKIQSALASSQYADKLIYYDVFDYMLHIMADKNAFGFTQPLDFLCDGGGTNSLPTEHMKECLSGGGGTWYNARPYFWFTAGNMETHVHQFIAENIKTVIDSHFG